MPKYKINIEYDGTDFVGWQKQENGISIQSSLEDAVYKLTSEDVKIFGAGGVRNSSDCELAQSFGAAGWLCSTVIHQGKKLI